MVPTVKISRVNLKPLFPPGKGLEDLDIKKALDKVRREMRKAMKASIEASAFSQRAKVRLARAMRMKVGPKSVTITTRDPAFRALLEGQKPGQMTWLVKAKAPIPIITDSGELIFRSATPKSMEDGSWYHPGRPKTTILDQAKAEARRVAKEYVVKELKRQLQRMVQQR